MRARLRAALLGATMAFPAGPPAAAQAPPAIQDVPTAERAVSRADAEGGEALLLALDGLTGALVIERRLAEAERVIARALAMREAAFGAGDPRTLRSLIDRTTVLRLLERDGLAALGTLVPRLAAIDPALLAARAPEVAYTLYHFAVLAQPSGSIALMRRALDLWAFAGATGEPVDSARAYLVLLLENARAPADAAEELTKLPPEHPNFVGRAFAVASLFQAEGDLGRAGEWLDRLFARPADQLGTFGPLVAQRARLVASDLGDLGRHDEAGALLERALRLQRAVLPPDSPEITDTLSRLATAAHRAGRGDEAITRFRETVAAFGRGPERDGATAAYATQILGTLLMARGDHREAEPHLERALAVSEQSGAPDQALRALLGRLKLERDALDEAETLLASALAAWPAGTDRHAHAVLLNDLGRLDDRRGRLAAAERHYRAALAGLDLGGASLSDEAVADRAKVLGNLAGVLWQTGRLDEAERVALEALSLETGRRVAAGEVDAMLRDMARAAEDTGPARLTRLATLETLALIRQSRRRDADVVTMLRDVVRVREAALAPGHRDIAKARGNLGLAQLQLGQAREATRTLRSAVAALPDEGVVAATLRINLAGALRETGSAAAIGEAVTLAETAQGMLETAMGAGEPAAIDALAELGLLYGDLGRLDEADTLLSRVVATQEADDAAPGDLARSLSNLASLRLAQGSYAEAETLLRRALALDDRLPAADPDRLARLSNLAVALSFRRRQDEALPLQEEIVARLRDTLPYGHPDLGLELGAMAVTLARLGRLDEADAALSEAMAIIGADGASPAFRNAVALRGTLALIRANADGDDAGLARALADLRRATELSSAPDLRGLPESGDHLPFHVHAALRVADGTAGATRRALLAEAFAAAQGIGRLSAARAVVAAGARRAAGDDALAHLVRRHQDALSALDGTREALAASFAPAAETAEDAAARRGELRARLARVAREAEGLAGTIAGRFPRYAALSDPEPLTLDEAQALLGADEALILFATSDLSRAVPGATGSTVIAVTREAVTAEPLAVDEELSEAVHKLRCAAALTDPRCQLPGETEIASRGAMAMAPEPKAGAARTRAPGFDTGLAASVYAATLGPIEHAVADKPHWIVVPDRTLVGLPFNLLVRGGANEHEASAPVPWLIRSHAVSVLPASAALRTSRGADAAPSRAPLAFLGVGDPEIGARRMSGADVACEPGAQAQTAIAAAGPPASLRAAGEALADIEDVRRLAALPETRCELQAIAADLGGDQGGTALLLGAEASEARVKRMSAAGELARYRTLSFATHGLLGDEVGRHEAALVLTPPETASPGDDGLLTAGEIAGLRLDADWVILSACNTAAGRDADDEGLSGLAAAFFHAGARSLLVSAWPVYSDAAARLTTASFAAQRADPAIGRAEALRRAMLSVLDDPAADARERHPAYWAPFIVAGEGGR